MISERAAEIFHEANTLAPDTRARFVDRSCAGDERLLREVQALLAAANESEAYFEKLAGRVGLEALSQEDEALPANKVIGQWRLLKRIGRGGMGAVYLAERADDHYEQRAALKILPTGLDSDQARARFLVERQILARLVHDNIARLLDGGVTDEGVPYFVMDYVEGLPIDEYCNEHQLGLEARLSLILDVARAAQFAHRNLIIHRDLKPSNVLVAEGGKVRLLDFGIAKMLEPDTGAAHLTQLVQRPATPAFASPEMLRGEPVDVTADVYSIGALMYVLFTGRVPLNYEGLSLAEMYDHTSNVVPPPVSNFNSKLQGDLDAIVAKALAKDPQERYGSVESLANDIRNYLNGLPVTAKAPSSFYRTRKFLMRHRLGASFTVFAIGALITIAALAVSSAITADRQAREIALERDRAERIGDFIASIFRDADPYTSDETAPLSAIDLLRQSEERLDTRASIDVLTRIELFITLGQSYSGLQDNASAIRVLEKGLRLADESGVGDPAVLANGRYWLSQAYGYLGYDDQALAALDTAAQTVAGLGESGEALRNEIPLQRAALLLHKGQGDEAVDVLSALIEKLERSDIGTGIEMAQAQQMLAVSYRRVARVDEALIAARRARNLYMQIYASDPKHPRIVDATMTYGRALMQAGNYAEGGEMIEEATRHTVRRFGADSMVAGHFFSSLAAAQIERGSLEDAVTNARQGLEVFLQQKQTGTLDHESRLRTLGEALLAMRQLQPAIQYLQQGVEIAGKEGFVDGERSGSVALGLALAYSGEFDRAEALLIGILQATGDGDDRSRYQAMRNLATAYRLQGRPAEALPLLQTSIAKNDVPASVGDRAIAMVEAGLAHLAQGDAAAAETQLDSAERIFKQLLVADTPSVADLMVARGRISLLKSKPTEAVAVLQRADAFWREFGPESRWAGVAAFWLARGYRVLGRAEEAAAAHARALRILSSSPLPVDVELLRSD